LTRRKKAVFKAHRLLYHSTLGLRVIKKKKTALMDVTPPETARFGDVMPPRNTKRQRLVDGNPPRNTKMQRFRGGLVFKAHRLVYHSTLGSRVIKKKFGVVTSEVSVASKSSYAPSFSRKAFSSTCHKLTDRVS